MGIISTNLYVRVPAFCPLLQLVLLKSTDGADIEWCKEVKGNMYDVVVEGFQMLSRWTARVWEQCAWKFSRPCKDAVPTDSQESSPSSSDYEKVFIECSRKKKKKKKGKGKKCIFVMLPLEKVFVIDVRY